MTAAALPAPQPLTPEQQLEADKLYRAVLAYVASGVRQLHLSVDGEHVGLRPIGKKAEIALLKNSAIVMTTR